MIFSKFTSQTLTVLIIFLWLNQPVFAYERVRSVRDAQEHLSAQISKILARKVKDRVINRTARIGIKGILYNGKHIQLSKKIESSLSRHFTNDSYFQVYDRSRLREMLKDELKLQNTDFHQDPFDAIPIGQFKSVEILITGEIIVGDDGVNISVVAMNVKTNLRIADVEIEIPKSAADNYLGPSSEQKDIDIRTGAKQQRQQAVSNRLDQALTGDAKREYQSCKQGDAAQCFNLGVSYKNGKYGASRNYSQAVKYFQQACDGGSADGCSNLDHMYKMGEEASKNDAMTAKYYQQACDGGNADGCNNLGYMYEYGKGVSKNYAMALKYYQQACDGGSANGCFNLGYMYDEGKGVSKDDAMAVKYYQKACDSGYDNGCRWAKKLE